MITKISRGSQYCQYLRGIDFSASPEPIVAELVDSEIILNESVDPLESTLTGGVAIPVSQGPNWGMIANLYTLNGPARLQVILDNTISGDQKQYFFLPVIGSNIISLFEPDLEPDQVSFFLLPMAVMGDLEFLFNLVGEASPNAYLGA